MKIVLKSGKRLICAEFEIEETRVNKGIFLNKVLLECTTMYIDDKKQCEHTTFNYFTNHYEEIETEYWKQKITN